MDWDNDMEGISLTSYVIKLDREGSREAPRSE
jgi:hypothetical protein